MTSPAYSTDLADIALGETGETWGEPTGATAGGNPAPGDTENMIQQAAGVSKTCAIVGGGLCGMGTQASTAKTITSPNAIFAWIFFASPGALNNEASGGLQGIVGQDLANYKRYYLRGKDTYAYSGWVCVPFDPNTTGQGSNYGSPNGTWQYFGGIASTTVTIAKGNPFAMDAIRYGRTLQCIYGDAGGYATFVGAAAKNDANDVTSGYNRWGLFQDIGGSYQQQGLFLMGTAATAVDFRDANRSIVIANTKRVTSTFNAFEVRNASSRVDWTAISITALGTTSRGNFITTHNADVNFSADTFTDMGTFDFLANSTVLTSTFRRCGMVTTGGGTFTSCLFESSYATAAVKATNPTLVSGCTFVSAGTGYAIEAITSGDYNSTNTYTGYAASDGNTGNEAFCNSSGGHINLTILSGTTPSVRNVGGGSSTTIIIPQVTLTIQSQVSLVGAEVRIYDMDGTLPSLGTELSGIESCVNPTYTYSGSAANVIWIQIMLAGYKEFGQQVTMPSANGSFTALLKKETNS